MRKNQLALLVGSLFPGATGFRVVSGEISESFQRSAVAETTQSGSVVVVDEGEDVVVAGGTGWEGLVMPCGVVRDALEVLGEAAVETLDHAVGLRPEGAGEPVRDVVAGAEAIEGVAAGRAIGGFALFVDGKAVGPFAAVVREKGVYFEREGAEEALEEGSGEGCLAPLVDLEVDGGGGAIDGDKGIRQLAGEAR